MPLESSLGSTTDQFSASVLICLHLSFLICQMRLMIMVLASNAGCVSCSIVSDSASPWTTPGKNTGVGCHALLQGIFLTQESNPVLPHFRQILYHLSYLGSLPMVGKRANWDNPIKCACCMSLTHASFCPHPAVLCCAVFFGCSLALHTCLFYLEARDLVCSCVPSIQQRATSTAGPVDSCRDEAGEAGVQ